VDFSTIARHFKYIFNIIGIFQKNVRFFKKSKAFLKHLKKHGHFLQWSEAFRTILRLFKDNFSELEAFDYKCWAFIKFKRLFEDIFREMEAF
jgi:hypothetical protein